MTTPEQRLTEVENYLRQTITTLTEHTTNITTLNNKYESVFVPQLTGFQRQLDSIESRLAQAFSQLTNVVTSITQEGADRQGAINGALNQFQVNLNDAQGRILEQARAETATHRQMCYG